MNWADFAIIGIISASTVISLFRGFVREFLSLAAWIVAFWAASFFLEPVSMIFEDAIPSVTVRAVLAFVGIFVSTLLGCGLINYFVGGLMGKTGLSGMDRLLGGLFGLFRGIAVVVIFVLIAGLTSVPDTFWWQQSLIVPPFEIVVWEIVAWLQPELTKHFHF